MKTSVSAALLAACLGVCGLDPGDAAAGEFYVAPDGNDKNPGMPDKPFATVARARDAVRRLVAAGLKEDITVEIRGGIYFLDKPLVFGPEDSGTEKHSITYAAWGEQMPVLSGGRRIIGWKKAQGKLWTVTVPEVKAGKWYFRQLFVDGRRTVRARTPNKNAEEYCWRLTGAELSQDLKHHTLTLGPGKLKKWKNLNDVEAVVLKNWATLHKKIEAVEPDTGVVVLQRPHVKYGGGNRPRKGGGCFFENAIEMLDEPGEWYLDRHNGLLTYWPLEGQDMDKAETIVPVLSHVVEIAGTAEKLVRNLHFDGIAVMHSHEPLPPEGHHGRQAAFRYGGSSVYGLPSMVRWNWANGCSFVGGRIAHAGGSGIALREGCSRNLIEGNEVFDIAGNGINVGGSNDERRVPKENRIANNYVHRCGEVYYGACAIWAGFAQKTTIEHNLVCDHPYTGISIGWCWNPSPTVAREYIVADNHIYDVMKRVCDGGCIYSLGYQPGTVLRGNHLHDVHRSRYAIAAPNNGIFLDEGSKGYLIEDNLIHSTSGRPVRHNRNSPDWHTWKNNTLVEGGLKPEHADALKQVENAGLEPKWRRLCK